MLLRAAVPVTLLAALAACAAPPADPAAQAASGQPAAEARENRLPHMPVVAPIQTQEDVPASGVFLAVDDDGDAIRFDLVTPPAAGTLTVLEDGRYEYTAPSDWSGTDEAEIRLGDGHGWSAPVAVAVEVAAVNDAPRITAVTGSGQVVAPGFAVTLTAAAEDVEGSAVAFTWIVDGETVCDTAVCSLSAPDAPFAEREVRILATDGAAAGEASAVVRTAGAAVTGFTATPGAANVWTFAAQGGSFDGTTVASYGWEFGGTKTAAGPAVAWSPAAPGIYRVALRVTDSAGYTSWFTAAAAVTTPAQWSGSGNDLQNTGQHGLAERLAGAVLPAPIATTGAVVYEVAVGDEANFPLSLSPNGAVVGTRWGVGTFARRATDGAALWTFDAWNYGQKAAVGADGTVYAAHNGGSLRALGELTGAPLWEATPGSGFHREPAFGADGRLFSVSEGRYLRAIDAADGATLWSFDFAPGVGSSNVAVDASGRAFAAAGATLYAVDPQGGEDWSVAFADAVAGVAVGADGIVYAGGLDDTLYAVAPTGAVLWSIDVGQDVNPPKFGTDGAVLVKTTNGNLTAVSPTGAFLWKYDCLGALPPAIGPDGTIYLGTHGEIVAFTPGGGVKWRYARAGVSFGSPLVDVEGYVYAATSDGKLLKFR